MTFRSIASFVLAAIASVPATAQAQATDVVTYYHADAIGSVRMITDASGQVVERYDYLPFGEPWPNEVVSPNRQRFAGKEKDPESGLGYFGARHYAGGTGRFTGVDPIMNTESALTEPQRFNRYSYSKNNPFKFVDPDGAEIMLTAQQQQAIAVQSELNFRALVKVLINIGRSINSPGHMTPEAEARYFEQPSSLSEARRMRMFDLFLTAAPLFGRVRMAEAQPTVTLQAYSGSKLAQQIARWREIGGTGGHTAFITFAEHLAQQAIREGTHVTGTIGSGPNAIIGTIYRVGDTYLVVENGVIRSFVPNAGVGGIVDVYNGLKTGANK